MRLRMIYVSNVLLAVGLMATVAFFLGRESATAQPGSGARPLRIGLVDFTKLSTDVNDVKKIEELMKHLGDLRRFQEEYYEAELRKADANLKAMSEYGQENTPDWDKAQEQFRDLVSRYESIKAVTEFRMKKLTMVYSSRLLNKILREVGNYSQNRFDIVHKVLGDPSDEEVARLGSTLGDAMSFNLGRAREVLYHATNSAHVEDITVHVARRVNLNNDEQVTRALDEEIAKIQKEIDEIRRKITG